MAASTNDKITDTRNAARPVSTTVSSSRAAGGTTLTCASLTGWPTVSKGHFVTYQIDTNSDPVAGTQKDCYGIVSGSTIGSLSVVDGTDTGNAVGDVVEMLPTAAWGQDLSDALLIGHTRTGAHVASLPLTTPVISSISNTGTITLPTSTDTLVGKATTDTLTNKRVTQRVGTVADAATVTPTGDDSDMYTVTAIAQAFTIAAPSGTPTNGQKLILRIKDNGTGRAITWNAIYRAIGVTLPTTTVATKTHYIGLIYNDAATKWDAVAVGAEA